MDPYVIVAREGQIPRTQPENDLKAMMNVDNQ
jgi:hypothetical protein